MTKRRFWRIPKSTTLYAPVPKVVRQPIERCIRSVVWEMTRGRCWWCGEETNPFVNFEVDHLVALKSGGPNALPNLVPSCSACNRRKSHRPVAEWVASLPGGRSWAGAIPSIVTNRKRILARHGFSSILEIDPK